MARRCSDPVRPSRARTRRPVSAHPRARRRGGGTPGRPGVEDEWVLQDAMGSRRRAAVEAALDREAVFAAEQKGNSSFSPRAQGRRTCSGSGDARWRVTARHPMARRPQEGVLPGPFVVWSLGATTAAGAKRATSAGGTLPERRKVRLRLSRAGSSRPHPSSRREPAPPGTRARQARDEEEQAKIDERVQGAGGVEGYWFA